MALIRDAMNPFPLKKTMQVKKTPSTMLLSQDSKSNYTLAFKAFWSRLYGTQIHQR